MSANATPFATAAARAVASPGLWTLAWRRLRRDRVGMVSLAIVAAFLVLVILSGLGLIAADWSREVGVNYAPPSFLGSGHGGEARVPAGAGVAGEVPSPPAPDRRAAPLGAPIPGIELPADGDAPYRMSIEDPIGPVLEELRAQLGRPPAAAPGAGGGSVGGAGAAGAAADDVGDARIDDPLADVLAELRRELGRSEAVTPDERRATLPLGGDKWGRDVLKKTIKGSETSVFVGLAAALVATVLGTLLGALAGFFGRAVDDVCNWFYSVFTSVPYLLLILAIAAVLQQRGTFTIILILGLTGWTGIFRLVRAEYLKHKSREYVQAADAIGASSVRRMFVEIFPNASHVVLVQLSLHVVSFIKAEVILTFLGFGVPVDVVSWGSMLNEAQNELILGKWWQLASAGTAMAILVSAFSLLTDALRDALDPKLG